MSDWYDANLVLVQATFVGLLLALSIQFPLRMGVFSFAGIGCYGIGAYLAAIVTIHQHWPALLTILVCVAVGGVVAFLLSLLVHRLGGLYLGMATISFDLIIGVVVTNGGDLTGGPTGLFGAITDLPMGQIILITVVVVVALAFTERGRLGRRILAVRDDPELAASVGVRVRRYRIAAFAVSGLIGGCAGAVNTLLRTTVGPTDIGFSLVVLALTMIIVGGTRSWLGALIGAVIFTWLPSLLEVVGQWQAVIYGVIVALAAIWMPGGLLGVVTGVYRAQRQRQLRQSVAVTTVVALDDRTDEEFAALAQLATDATAGRTP